MGDCDRFNFKPNRSFALKVVSDSLCRSISYSIIGFDFAVALLVIFSASVVVT